jgi:hypothetical protein
MTPGTDAPSALRGLIACPVAPLVVELAGVVVTITHADLMKHAGRHDVAGVICTSSTYATAETGGTSYPDLKHLRTRRPRMFYLWAGDSMRLHATNPGQVSVHVLVPTNP